MASKSASFSSSFISIQSVFGVSMWVLYSQMLAHLICQRQRAMALWWVASLLYQTLTYLYMMGGGWCAGAAIGPLFACREYAKAHKGKGFCVWKSVRNLCPQNWIRNGRFFLLAPNLNMRCVIFGIPCSFWRNVNVRPEKRAYINSYNMGKWWYLKGLSDGFGQCGAWHAGSNPG